MPSLLDRIRNKMTKSFVSSDKINEINTDGLDTPGVVFKSFDAVTSKKANAEWAQEEPRGDMFGNAYDGMPDYPRDSNDDPESALTGAMDITPEDYDVDSELVPPRQEWIQKKQAQQDKEMQQNSPEMEGRNAEEGYY